jgi:hypothetical protein
MTALFQWRGLGPKKKTSLQPPNFIEVLKYLAKPGK